MMAVADPVAREASLESGVFAKRGLQIVAASGAWLEDASGTRYLDAGATLGTNHVGHCHPTVVARVQDQVARVGHVTAAFGNDVRLDFLERLIDATPAHLTNAFLCNSGTESVEAALKFARLATGRTEIVALSRAFHGRTFGALSCTAKPAYRDPFLPLLEGVRHVRPDDLDALHDAVGPNTAAIIVEPIQGEGGIHPLSADYLRAVRDVASDRGALVIADEVQTGLGRTGSFLASEPAGLRPDIVTLGKGLGGGLPLAATMVSPEVAASLQPALHGATFSGNPITCAAGAAVLDIIRREDLAERAAASGQWLQNGLLEAFGPDLAGTPIREIRGRGLMLGVDLRQRPGPMIQRLQDAGVLTSPAGTTTVRLLPPLNLADEERALLLEALVVALRAEMDPAAPMPDAA